MAHFYGEVRGTARGSAHRIGGKSRGLETFAASYEGCCNVQMWHNEQDGKDWCTVRLRPWRGRGETRMIWKGPVDGSQNGTRG